MENKLERILKQVRKFNSFENARSASHRFIKPARVLMGDDGRYWVTTIGEASILEKAGYEIVY